MSNFVYIQEVKPININLNPAAKLIYYFQFGKLKK